MTGLSTSTSISFGCAFVAGRNRVPRPAAGKTALRTAPDMRRSYRSTPPSRGALRRGKPAFARRASARQARLRAVRFGAAGAVVRCERERAHVIDPALLRDNIEV